ncbi:MAG: iron-sulfur cluster repair di-iron protein [Phycisphaerales bacterium]|nr:iron-sulfur cluster repair di-iron protein [Phycisphaerales bacterium]
MLSVTSQPSLNLTNTVAQWVRQDPARSRIFEKYGIDYCCGGKATLQQACEKRGLQVDEVLAALHSVQPSADQSDWSTATLSELADHIEQTHHTFLKSELPRVAALLSRTAKAHGARHVWLAELKATFDRFAAEMNAHMFKEEHILFPRIRRIDEGDPSMEVDQPVAMMEHEHDRAGSDLEAMRQLSNNYSPPQDACNTFVAALDALRQIEKDTHIHVHKENNILFPKSISKRHKAHA